MSYVDVCISVISPDVPLLLVWLFDSLFMDCVSRSTMGSTYK
jgi:hypothetical protein